MSLHVNDGGTWKEPTPQVNDGGTWKTPDEVFVNDGGTWKSVWLNGLGKLDLIYQGDTNYDGYWGGRDGDGNVIAEYGDIAVCVQHDVYDYLDGYDLSWATTLCDRWVCKAHVGIRPYDGSWDLRKNSVQIILRPNFEIYASDMTVHSVNDVELGDLGMYLRCDGRGIDMSNRCGLWLLGGGDNSYFRDAIDEGFDQEGGGFYGARLYWKIFNRGESMDYFKDFYVYINDSGTSKSIAFSAVVTFQ